MCCFTFAIKEMRLTGLPSKAGEMASWAASHKRYPVLEERSNGAVRAHGDRWNLSGFVINPPDCDLRDHSPEIMQISATSSSNSRAYHSARKSTLRSCADEIDLTRVPIVNSSILDVLEQFL